jgi:hypothetical protein
LANNPQAFSIAKQLRDSLEASGNGVDTAAESAGNVAKAQAATAKISSSRGAWVDQMAKTLHEAGITSADVGADGRIT